MNWFKKAQLQKTLPYFQEFEEYGDYVPDEESLSNLLRDKFGVSIITDIGQGDSGVAYLLSNGDVLKITTNKQEGQVSEFLQSNKNPAIVDIKHVWREGDLYYIIEEKLEMLPNEYVKYFQYINTVLDSHKCYNPKCSVEILQDLNLDNESLKQEIISYLTFLSKIPQKIFDFLNVNNIGISNGHIKFFDIT